MAPRSRKSRPATPPSRESRPATPPDPPLAESAPPPADAGDRPEKESRSELRSDARRAELVPLAPGERPLPLVTSAVLGTVLGLLNLVLYLAGSKIGGRHPGPGVLSFSVVMLAAAWGMWGRRYWAVLAFQALLALAVLTFSLFLVEASNLEALALCLTIVIGGGWLFWKLVGVMARIQMPTGRVPD